MKDRNHCLWQILQWGRKIGGGRRHFGSATWKMSRLRRQQPLQPRNHRLQYLVLNMLVFKKIIVINKEMGKKKKKREQSRPR
jgi:hypothetical protein